MTVCPLCRADLATNIHPLEKRFELIVLAPIVIGFIVVFGFSGVQVVWAPVLGFVVLSLVLAGGYLHVKTRDWQRFRRHDGK